MRLRSHKNLNDKQPFHCIASRHLGVGGAEVFSPPPPFFFPLWTLISVNTLTKLYLSSALPHTSTVYISPFFLHFSLFFLHFSAYTEQICFPAKPGKYSYDHLRPLTLLNGNNGNSKQLNRPALSGRKGQDFASHISSAFPNHCFLYSQSGKTSSKSIPHTMPQSTHDSGLQNLALSFLEASKQTS